MWETVRQSKRSSPDGLFLISFFGGWNWLTYGWVRRYRFGERGLKCWNKRAFTDGWRSGGWGWLVMRKVRSGSKDLAVARCAAESVTVGATCRKWKFRPAHAWGPEFLLGFWWLSLWLCFLIDNTPWESTNHPHSSSQKTPKASKWFLSESLWSNSKQSHCTRVSHLGTITSGPQFSVAEAILCITGWSTAPWPPPTRRQEQPSL